MPGALASSCNPATWRQVLLDGLRKGLLFLAAIRWLLYKQNLDRSPFSILNSTTLFIPRRVTHPGTNTTQRCLTSGQWQIEIQTLIAPVGAFRNCLRRLCFKSKWRGIRYSFQLAITAPLYLITGYCIATAQSYLGLNNDLH